MWAELVPGEALSVRVMRSAVSGVFLLGSWQFNPWFLVVHSVVPGGSLCGFWSFTLWFLVIYSLVPGGLLGVLGGSLCGFWSFTLWFVVVRSVVWSVLCCGTLRCSSPVKN